MAHPSSTWLLEPTLPAPPTLPRFDCELYALAGLAAPYPDLVEPGTPHESGTWRVGEREQDQIDQDHEEADDDARFATSDREAPTVRPGALHATKSR